jgi:amphiphysin
MQRVQRKLGRFLPRTPNEADVEGMLRDFTDSDKMLEKV